MAYGLGSNGGYTLKNEYNYRVPQVVKNLMPRKSPFDPTSSKSLENADETPSITDYYNGGNNINTMKVQCRMYVSQKDCLHQSGCGWCGATASCIGGNQAGPMEACSKSTYVFTTGAIHNPEERVIQENIGGVSMTILQK